jgi:GNAT superfamily N-acetyltransferase
MSGVPRLVEVHAGNFDSMPCCGIKDAEHPGRCEKRCWFQATRKFGVRLKTLMAPDGSACGHIEYLPGEYAWRAVNAHGYLFIHCLWIRSKEHRRQGWGSLMIEAALEDARREGREGVAALSRTGPWLADSRIYKANGFVPSDFAPPDFELLAYKFDPDVPGPKFRGDRGRKQERYPNGLTIIRSGQCPYIAKFSAEIVEAAREEYNLEPAVVDLRSYREAQNAPTPYAVFAVIYEGRVVADHPISRTRFRNIMAKVRK